MLTGRTNKLLVTTHEKKASVDLNEEECLLISLKKGILRLFQEGSQFAWKEDKNYDGGRQRLYIRKEFFLTAAPPPSKILILGGGLSAFLSASKRHNHRHFLLHEEEGRFQCSTNREGIWWPVPPLR